MLQGETASLAGDPVSLSGDRWDELSPHLDTALDLEDAARERWLDDLGRRDPQLARELCSILGPHRSDDELRSVLEGDAGQCVDLEEPEHEDALVGQSAGAYRIESQIGHGGMGTVWLARRDDGLYDGTAAVKVLNMPLAGRPATARLQREGNVLARLNHPHIARLLDAGQADAGWSYLVLEYVQGDRIDRYCDQRRLDLRARIALFLGVLDAVSHAHTHLVVHRDIKPSNVLVTPEGVVKLLDFGIAKLLQDANEAEAGGAPATRTMTPEYASPEQLRDEPASAHSDVYSLGVLLFLLLTGRHPTGQDDAAVPDLIHAIVSQDALRASMAARSEAAGAVDRAAERGATPRQLQRQLSGDLDTILARALKRARDERYASAAEFGADLRRFLRHEPILARPDSLRYRAAKFMRRHRVALPVGVAAAAAVVAGVSVAVVQGRAAEEEALHARSVQTFMLDLFKANRQAHADPTAARATTARDLLDLGAARIDTAFGSNPRAQVEIGAALAGMYVDLGLFKEAAALWQRAADTARQHGGLPPRQHVQLLLDLSSAARGAQAIAQRDKALEEARSLLAAQADPPPGLQAALLVETAWQNHPDRYETMADLAAQAARQYKALGDHAGVVRALTTQVSALLSAPRYREIETVAREALAAAVHVPKETLSARVLLHGSLGYALNGQMRRQDAMQALRAGLDLAVQELGEQHNNTAAMRFRVAQGWLALGRLPEAIAEGRRAVAAVERFTGADDAFWLPSFLVTLGNYLLLHGELDAALRSIERGVGIDTKAGTASLAAADREGVHAMALMEAGDLAGAERALERSNSLLRSSDQQGGVGCNLVLAKAQLQLARRSAAEVVRRALADMQAECVKGEVEDFDVAVLLAEAGLAVGHPAGEAMLARSRKLAEVEPQSVSPLQMADVLVLEGRYALRAGDPAQARAAFEQAVHLRQGALHPQSPRLAEARVWLAHAWLAAGRAAEARALLEPIRSARAAHAGIGAFLSEPLASLEAALRQR